jgi:hypothetical protein
MNYTPEQFAQAVLKALESLNDTDLSKLLLQGVDRDTQKFAMKCSSIEVDDVEVLETVYENGRILKEYTFDEVRRNAAI